MEEEIEEFFIYYNKSEGKKFVPIKWSGAGAAINIINKHSTCKG